MKVKMKKVMMAISFAVILSVGTITTASARFWGWQTTSTTDWADGHCAYREVCRVHYVLWFSGSEQCDRFTVGCID